MEINPIVIEEVVKPVKLSKDERKKLRWIKRLINKQINGPIAAKKLGVTTRQIRNLKRAVLNFGDEGIIHKNRFNKPVNTYDDEIRVELAHIYRTEYKGMNFTAFAKIMQEERGFVQSRSTIYNILRQKRIRSPQRKKNKRKKVSV
ncbi:MAG: hypothetical protein WCT17_05850 [Bacilli bacterium]